MKASAILRRIYAAFIAVLTILLSFNVFFVTGETYSDTWMLGYNNMEPEPDEEDVVPTLYKNDAVFANHRRFPLVVHKDVHYVPVEMFSGLSGIRLTYGYSIYYFYLATQDGTRYISFDIENEAVTTHEKKTYSLKTMVFYNTRYLPVKEVAKVLGLTMEIYDNPDESIYAVRLSDGKEKISFSELIRMYKPIKKDETEKDPVIPDNPPPVTDNPQVVPDIGRRHIYITLDTQNFAGISDTLSVLERNFSENKAVFFVSASDILKFPDEIRQIIAYGQNVGVLIKGKDAEKEYLEAKENLRLVAKCSTRLVRFSAGSTTRALTDEEYSAFVEKYGVCVWDYNVNVIDSKKLYDNLYGLSGNSRNATAVLRIPHGTNSDTALLQLKDLVKSKNQLTVYTTDETVKPVNYR